MSSHRWPFDYDGLIGEGWSGVDPDGAHVNVVLAERGTPTAAALLTTFTSPAPGHAPILVVVGEDKDHYEPVWPPTIMINKATATEEMHQTITWGAGQLGIAQGVLDAVAAEVIPCSGDLLVFVAIYIDPGATDESAVRVASRAATLKGIRTARQGRDPATALALVDRRDALRSPFYGGE
jgi:5,6,7,8-tetrahydromethanopterin hydro-lyase